MAKKTLIYILAILAVFVLINSVVIMRLLGQSKKTVVVDVIKVATEFKLKKDLESKVAVKLNNYSAGIDSLKAVFNAQLHGHASQEVLALTAKNIDTLQNQARQAYVVSDKSINEQIWQRLNTLINEYGEMHGYRLMIGANGMGTVLYNEKELDKTEELIKFINEKYESGR